MDRVLRAAGIPSEVLRLIPAVVETCTTCRAWQRPAPSAIATSSTAQTFNSQVEADLVFIKPVTEASNTNVLLLTDRCTRWVSAGVVSDKETPTLLTALDRVWTSMFGPPKELFVDGETGLDSEECDIWFRLRGVRKHTLAPGQHTRIGDAKAKQVRDLIHKVGTQLHSDGLT
eukprot:5822447-Amphidinium_carterae.1